MLTNRFLGNHAPRGVHATNHVTSISRTETCLLTGALLPWTGGPTRSIGAFQRALDATVVSFVASHDASQHALPLNPAHLRLVTCARVPGMHHLLIPRLSSLWAARPLLERAALVSCHSFYNSYPLWLWHHVRRSGKPYWFVPHGILDPYVMGRNAAIKKAYLSLFGRRFLANTAATVFSSTAERDKAIQVARVANPRVIPWPVEIPKIQDRAVRRLDVRAGLGIPEDAKVMLFLGRLHTMKRPEQTIQLFAAATSHDWHLLFVGHPDNVTTDRLHKVAATCGARTRVHTLEGVTHANALDIISGCDLFISFSHRENFNNAAAECLASGLPVLLSRGNDLLSVLNGTDAVGVLPEDTQHAKRVIAMWTSMPESERLDRGTTGREWAARNLSYDAFANAVTALRAECLGAA